MKPSLLAFVWRLARFGVVLPLLVAAAMAQQLVVPTTNPPGSRDTCLQRNIPVTFIKNTQTAPPLRLQDLQVAVKGGSASIISLVQEKHAPRVILLIDTSGSMAPPTGESACRLRNLPPTQFLWKPLSHWAHSMSTCRLPRFGIEPASLGKCLLCRSKNPNIGLRCWMLSAARLTCSKLLRSSATPFMS